MSEGGSSPSDDQQGLEEEFGSLTGASESAAKISSEAELEDEDEADVDDEDGPMNVTENKEEEEEEEDESGDDEVSINVNENKEDEDEESNDEDGTMNVNEDKEGEDKEDEEEESNDEDGTMNVNENKEDEEVESNDEDGTTNVNDSKEDEEGESNDEDGAVNVNENKEDEEDEEDKEDEEVESNDEDGTINVRENKEEEEGESNDEDGAMNINEDKEEEEEEKDEEEEKEEESDDEEGAMKVNEEDKKEDEESDDEKGRQKIPEDFVYDFDLMMHKKKEETYRKRKRKNIDLINDNDDIIAELIAQMKQAAEDDFELNKDGKAATRKLKLLPLVETQLRKIDLREAFLDAGVLGVITDWLTPLLDRSLPNLQVRETMLKILSEFNIVDVERLKASGIGKAVMYLYKHPKETKENKRQAAHLIACWSRPIFSLDTDFHSMSKEEREQRDFDHMTKVENKKARVETLKSTPSSSRRSNEEKTLRPGDKGWVPRARVPMPSTRDYVIRPKSNVEFEITRGSSKRAITRLDRHMRNFREKKKLMKTQRAVQISIEGRRMSL